MKNALIILLLLLSNILGATTYYVSTTGSDSNSGSSSSPWKTLAYACSKVTTSGDIIYVNSGTYNETSQCNLAPGVSITGAGVTSIISYTYSGADQSTVTDGAVVLSSNSGASTNGNQSISYLKFDGNNWTATRCIAVNYRNNVNINNCTFVNFHYSAVSFEGSTNNYPTAVSTYHSTGNSLHDCTIANCSKSLNGDGGSGGNYGHLIMSGQSGFLAYNNIFDNTGIATNYEADTWNASWLKDCKLYNNVLSRNNDINAWNFFSEIFFTEGGLEIYGNTYNGNATLDIVDVRPGSSGFGCKIHNNTWANTTQQSVNAHGIQAIDFEERGAIQYCYVYDNHFKNTNTAIQFDALANADSKTLVSGNITIDHIYVYYNLFENIGNTTNNYSVPIDIKPEGDLGLNNIAWDQIYIDNNTMISGGSMYAGILCETGGTMTNLYFRNNIIRGAASYPILFSNNLNGSVTTVNSQKNLYYQNATNAIGYSGVTVSGLTEAAVPSANPLFVSSTDFHLQPTSPAIGAGIHITTPSITNDIEGSAINNPPDIGAYKSGTAVASAAPVYQSSAIANATPSLLIMTYNMTLAGTAPAPSSFNVVVNSLARTVSSIAISGTQVQLTLATPVKYGDLVTVAYTKPAVNPLQSSTGVAAASISAQLVTNNLVSSTKDAVPLTLTMTISPNHVHNILNILLTYSTTPTTAYSPEILQITDISGNLLIEKLLVTGVTNILIPLNLASGIYNILMSAGGSQVASQRMIVY